MTRVGLALLCLLAGCDRIFQLDTVDPNEHPPRELDATIDTVDDAITCYGSAEGLFQYCPREPLLGEVALDGDLPTGQDPRCVDYVQPSGVHVCLVAAERIVIAQPLTVRGAKPLVLVASDSISVSALVDASSTPVRTGGGAQSSCGTAGNGDDAGGGGAGGAGASFGFLGGTGQPGGASAVTAHAPDGVYNLIDVRGGCPGYRGGRPTTGTSIRAPGGDAGGAVYFIAGTQISILSGGITAGGQGGRPGNPSYGGGGGGSGGLIGLDAPAVHIYAPLVAAGGGGGGGGSDTTMGTAGLDGGSSPSGSAGGGAGGPSGTVTNAGGGGAPGCGGPDGTVGGFTTGTPAKTGGGAGGGACGYIRVLAASRDVTALTSPMITP